MAVPEVSMNDIHKISDIKEQYWPQMILSIYCICLCGRCHVWPVTHLEV